MDTKTVQEPWTLQEVFNRAYIGLRDQGFRQSKDFTKGCRYRSKRGLKCAIGHCIDDDQYDADMEGQSASRLMHNYSDVLIQFGSIDRLDLNSLQTCHDSYTDLEMRDKLIKFAHHHGLTVPS